MHIVGAGLAGLLAGNMLAHHHPVLFERKASLPNNHSAVLRFRTSQIGDITKIPFKKVTMIKATAPWKNQIADVLAYSYKNTSVYRSDRSIISGTVVEDRYIAPPHLISLLARDLNIEFNDVYFFNKEETQPIISTIPMPVLMAALDYPYKPDFTYSTGYNIHANIKHCDAYVSLLVPDPAYPFSRISITGNEAIIECPSINDLNLDQILAMAAEILGISYNYFYDTTIHKQPYSKINPIGDAARKNFMFWATDEFGIYSLGRFATWRPGLLLDDLVQDIRLIDKWITDKYSRSLNR